MNFERTLEDVVETLQAAKHRGKSCTLLIGAGCSVEAGIPNAQGFVNIIKARHPRAYERAKEKTYGDCMAQLSPDERRDLLSEFIDKAKVNWAHVAIAQLMRHGYVDRVLTTNFDPLVVRACALAGVYPAVFDLAASGIFRADWVTPPAVIYLHGQRSGFVMKNVKDDFHYGEAVEEALDDAGRRRMWLVVGYSGANDPVFDRLAATARFDNNLYWVGYKDTAPADHIREGLLKEGKFGHYVRGYDADGFLVLLCQRLGIFPPEFIARPFTYLDGILATLTSFTPPAEDGSAKSAKVGVADQTRKLLRKAIESLEGAPSSEKERPNEPARPVEAVHVPSMILSGDYLRVVETLRAVDRPLTPDERRQFVLAATEIVRREFSRGAVDTSGGRPFSQTREILLEAERIEPDSPILQKFWGMRLFQIGKGTKNAAVRESTLLEAAARLTRATRKAPTDPNAHYFLARTYQVLAEGGPADEVAHLRKAAEYFEIAERLDSDQPTLKKWQEVVARLLALSSGSETSVHQERLSWIARTLGKDPEPPSPRPAKKERPSPRAG